MSSSPTLSLRDPHGQLIALNDRLLRVIHQSFTPEILDALQRSRVQDLAKQGKLVAWQAVPVQEIPPALWPKLRFGAGETGLVLEHPRVWFPSYPTEWSAPALHQAGLFTLELCKELLGEGLTLKDATPYNILFRGTRPLLCDLLSLSRISPRQATWNAAGQFIRCFLNPLYSLKYNHQMPHEIYALHRDGIEAESIFLKSGKVRRFFPPLLTGVTLPVLLQKRLNSKTDSRHYQPLEFDDTEKARFVFNHLLDSLERRLKQLKPTQRKTVWTEYMVDGFTYDSRQLSHKEKIVDSILSSSAPGKVLDIGCNTGHFSFMAARHGHQVVAIDSDPQVVGQLWEKSAGSETDILPLIVNLARPTPAAGWQNQETLSFLDRSRKTFDGVLVLAALHHLLVTEGIPCEEILRLFAQLTRGWCVIEYVPPIDKGFQALSRGRDYSFFTQQYFEKCLEGKFKLIQKHPIENSERVLYLLEVIPLAGTGQESSGVVV